jgi:hypothetical protein
MTKSESTKSEYRNPKQIQMTKTNAMFQTTPDLDSVFWIFRVWDLFGCGLFRIWCFGFTQVFISVRGASFDIRISIFPLTWRREDFSYNRSVQ